MNHDEYTTLVERARAASDLYYNNPDDPLNIPDEQFDEMIAQIEAYEATNPDRVRDDSPTKVVEVQTTSGSRVLFSEVTHRRPMLSLAKITDDESLESFLVNVGQPFEFEVSAKLDGMALSLEYDGDGNLMWAASRGDGRVGEDLTQNALQVTGIPKKIETDGPCSIRGEVLITLDDFEHMSSRFANPRNAAAGGLRSKDPNEAKDRKLTFFAYDLVTQSDNIGSSREAFDVLWAMGFDTPVTFFTKSITKTLEHIHEIFDKRDELPYEIDGVVVKASSYKVRNALGFRERSPKWAVAYKQAGKTTVTTLKSVTWQVGKSGIVAPVAELAPATLEGTTIKRATLHNIKYIRDLGLAEGCRVKIIRAGQVIPRVEAKEGDLPADATPISLPTACPSCGGSLREEGESKILRCTNIHECKAQRLGRLEAWAARSAADIDAIGPTWIEAFTEAGILTAPSDFYKISRRHLLSFERMGDTLAEKFIDSIDTSRQVGMRGSLIGMCIPHCSEGTATRLCRHFDSVEAVAQASYEQLVGIEDIGPVVAKSIHSFFASDQTREEVLRLRSYGVNLDRLEEDAPVEILEDNPFVGKKFVITGKLSAPRSEVKKALESLGAKVSSSISGSTDFLLAGEKAGSKLKKAQDLGVTVYSEEDLERALSQYV